ncbi:aminotransferase class IV [Hyphobacterium sp. CCMP332]|nr:aminotransferase class IV [Hyphobacterium sp. CCMP332]
MLVNFNGNIIKDSNLGLDQLFRASLFADGLFESIYCEKNVIFFLEEHLSRLIKGMECLGLEFSTKIVIEDWKNNINGILKENKYPDYTRLRIMVWRQGKGTYNTSGESLANYLIFCETCSPFNIVEIKKIAISEHIKIANSWYSNFKTINGLNYVGVSIEKTNKGLDELLIKNDKGFILEGSSSNIICVREDLIITPKRYSGQVDGIMNAWLIAYLKSNDLRHEEQNLLEKDISSSDLVIFCNSFIIKVLNNNSDGKIKNELTGILDLFPRQPLPL